MPHQFRRAAGCECPIHDVDGQIEQSSAARDIVPPSDHFNVVTMHIASGTEVTFDPVDV